MISQEGFPSNGSEAHSSGPHSVWQRGGSQTGSQTGHAEPAQVSWHFKSHSGGSHTVRHSLHEVWHAVARGAQLQVGAHFHVQSAPMHERVQESWVAAAQMGSQSGTASHVVVQPCAVSPAAKAHTAGRGGPASGDEAPSGAGAASR